MSGPAPTAFRSSAAALVLTRAAASKTLELMTRGTSETEETRWPRASRRGVTADAAMAEAVAKRFWFRLIFWCHFLQTLVGANMRPVPPSALLHLTSSYNLLPDL